MREEIYGWMKNLAVYYIFLTAIMNFIPDEKYARYIRYFTGMLLILLLCSPILQLFRLEEPILENFYHQVWQSRETMMETGDEEQRTYLTAAYEKEIAAQLSGELKNQGISVREIAVNLDSECMQIAGIVLYMEGEKNQKREEEIARGLEEKYQIGRETLSFFYCRDGEKTVGASSSLGSASGGNRHAGERTGGEW